MREGNDDAPIFKKRFARRKTTHRPFTFARHFENDAADNAIVSQVGDRGMVITSQVKLTKTSEGLTISDIVRQSPVPVLIAHSTPKEKQEEPPHKSPEEEEERDEEANSSLLRRSFRSREPSNSFLNRNQHPHGLPQQAKSHHAPDEYYIGSKNTTSNIDAEISITEEDVHPRGGTRTGPSASSSPSTYTSRASKHKSKQKPDPSSSASDRTQPREGSESAKGGRSDSKVSTKNSSVSYTSSTTQPNEGTGSVKGGRSGSNQGSAKNSSRRNKSAFAGLTSSSSRRIGGRKQAALDRTPSPKGQTETRTNTSNSNTETKRSGPASIFKRQSERTVERSPLSDKNQNEGVAASSSSPLPKRKKTESVSSSPKSKSNNEDTVTSSPLLKKKKNERAASSSLSKRDREESVTASGGISRPQQSVSKNKTPPPSPSPPPPPSPSPPPPPQRSVRKNKTPPPSPSPPPPPKRSVKKNKTPPPSPSPPPPPKRSVRKNKTPPPSPSPPPPPERSVRKNKTPPPPPPQSPPKGKKAGGTSASSGKSKALTAKRTRSPPHTVREASKANTVKGVEKTKSQKRSESLASRGSGKSLSRSKSRSLFSGEEEGRTSGEDDRAPSAAVSMAEEPEAPTTRKTRLARGQKENVLLRESRDSTPSPSVQGRKTRRAESVSVQREDGSNSQNIPNDVYQFSSGIKNASTLVASSTKKRMALAEKRDFAERMELAEMKAFAEKKGSKGKSARKNLASRLSALADSNKTHTPDNNCSSGNESTSDVNSKRTANKDSESVRRKKRSPVESSQGPSPGKRAKKSGSQLTDTGTTVDQSVRQKSQTSASLSNSRSRRLKQSLLTMTPNNMLTKTSERQSVQKKKNRSENTSQSQASSRLSVHDDDLHSNSTKPKSRQIPRQTSAVKISSQRAGPSSANRSPAKTVSKKSAPVRMSPSKRISNSFWRTSRPASSARPKNEHQVLSQASYINENFEEGRVSSSTTAARKATQRGPSTAQADHRGSEHSEDGEEAGPSKQRPLVTELGIIVNTLTDVEQDFMEEYAASRPCLKMVHKAFSFAKRQLKDTDEQLKQIRELEKQVTKLKSACKDLSSESKEKLQEKFDLQKEMQSMKSQGVDGDLLVIDKWIRDLHHLRETVSYKP